MALFPQFPYANLHELNLDWLIENISQLLEEGTVISVNGMSGRVTLYTEKDVELPPRAFDTNWSVYRRIANKMAGLQFTGEKFFYITKNVDDEDFTIQEVFTSTNPPPYPVTSVNGRIGTVIIAGDNTPYNMDGEDTIETVVSNIQKAIGPVVQYRSCSVGVTAGQYVYLFMSGISGRTDGIYKAANNKSANTTWTSADLIPVSGGIGGLIATLTTKLNLATNAGTLPNNTDLNTITETCIYYLSGTYTYTNAPIEYGVFETYNPRNDLTYIKQTITTATHIYIRTYSNNTWGVWREVALKNDIDTLEAKLAKILGAGTLPNNTDLNTIVETCLYHLSGTYTYSNAPIGYGVFETSNPRTDTLYLKQTITTGTNIFYRSYSNNTWSSWRKLEGTVVS